MPKASNTAAIDRLLEILKRLPTKRPGITASELTNWLRQEGYKVSKRTVERDLSDLAGHFPIYCNDRSKPYGWYWIAGEAPDLPSLTMADAMSLYLVEELLRPLLPGAILDSLTPRFQQARKKLAAQASSNPNARWVEKVRHVQPALPLLPPKLEEGVLETVQDALLGDQQIEVAYQRPDADEPQDLRLHPLGLVQRGPVTYLVATAFDYTDIRIYAVHRIREANKTKKPVKRPENFALDEYITQGALHFGNGKKIKLVADVSEWLATILTETPLSEGQVLEEIGENFRMTATVDDTWQLYWWILSFGGEIEVMKPTWLRRLICQKINEVKNCYNL